MQLSAQFETTGRGAAKNAASSHFRTCRPAVLRRLGAALIVSLLTAIAARADIISMSDVARGITMTQQQCAAIPQAVWITVYGRNFCIRYYYSTAGGQGSRPVVFLQGDLGFNRDPKTDAWVPPPSLKDTNTDDLVKYADTISRTQKTAAIYLARMGRDGSSGWHRQRHSVLEMQVTNAALDAIKKRYGFDGFNVYGHSGGAMVAAGLLSLRRDIGCAVLADGWLSAGTPGKQSDPAKQYFDAVTQIASIAHNQSGKIFVVSDPQDMVVSVGSQTPFIEALHKAGGHAEQFFVHATDEEHHFTTPHAEVVMNGCLRGASYDEIALDLAQLEVKLLTGKVRADAVTGARIADAPPPVPGRPLNGVNLLGRDYSNFSMPQARFTLCQSACQADVRCAAWTYVQPGVLGAAQARCWLNDHVPNQYRNACCVSGVEKH